MSIRFEKIWVQQCKATKGIKRRFGVKSALDYLIREKLLNFADAAEQHPEFARELPRFLAEVWRIFNQYELAGYVASLKPKQRTKLRSLLYLRPPTRGPATARVGSGWIDRPWPGMRSMKPLASSVITIWWTEGGVTRK
jgi:hypothetical protein